MRFNVTHGDATFKYVFIRSQREMIMTARRRRQFELVSDDYVIGARSMSCGRRRHVDLRGARLGPCTTSIVLCRLINHTLQPGGSNASCMVCPSVRPSVRHTSLRYNICYVTLRDVCRPTVVKYYCGVAHCIFWSVEATPLRYSVEAGKLREIIYR